MSLYIPTTQESVDSALNKLESALSTRSPLNEKAFLRVLAVIEGMITTSMYKYGAERAKQSLALTATGDDLERIGNEYSTPRKQATTCVVNATITGSTVPITSEFIGAVNGVRYFLSAVSGTSLELYAEVAGTAGNLQADDILNIVSPVAGAASFATVTSVVTTGADRETDTAYRPRVLFAERAVTGGGNATDYKIWAEGVSGVYRAFPYAGKPIGGGTSYPGDRTVYVESDTTINADGIPTVGLLAQVRAAINADPDTGESRPALGLVDSTLFVQAISRSAVAVTITGLTIAAELESAVKADINDALDAYYLALVPFVEGVDLPQERNDVVTNAGISAVIQEVVQLNGGSVADVGFTIGGTGYLSYTLNPGVLTKRGTVTYAI